MRTDYDRRVPRVQKRPSIMALLAALLVALSAGPLAVPLAGQTQEPSQSTDWESPTFFIESIRIDGLRHARPGPILAELRLNEGATYSENELRQATYRAQRLPFVLTADLRLEKGSERERFVLVVGVDETSRFFLVDDLSYRYREGQTFEFTTVDPDGRLVTESQRVPGDYETVGAEPTGGARLFLGRNGMAFATVSPLGVSVGYTQYNLFGTRGFATVAVRESTKDGGVVREDDETGFAKSTNREFSLAAGFPIGRNQSLQFTLSADEDNDDVVLNQESTGAELRWFHDTTDDPFFPTNGWRVTSGAALLEGEFSFLIANDSIVSKADETALFASGLRYFPVGERSTLWAGAGYRANRADITQTRTFGGPPFESGTLTRDSTIERGRASASLGWGRPLFERRSGRKFELRLETAVEGAWFDEDVESSFDVFRPGIELDSEVELSIALAFRNRWSVLRVGVGYIDQDYN